MKRIEVIPYKDLDERFDLCRKLEIEKRNKAFQSISDLGNCFYIEHFNIGSYADMRV
ncbi:TPA: hypothetical protein PTW06_003670 [Clostridium botulinum]|nr:hypothetical protein [Clostridium botulinum]HDK7226237.1 hypothetical protein [Clostridium botulinum]HDK7273730.1 hypothetical protein [Clostridium botulinum]HDK7307078.1 hypothetical protein [Clostridium botulinum]HDK7314595.1 hypothetical protein [Clostridium botulinum]